MLDRGTFSARNFAGRVFVALCLSLLALLATQTDCENRRIVYIETWELLIGQTCVALHVKIEIGWHNDMSNHCLLLRSVRRSEGHLSSISRVFVVKSRVCFDAHRFNVPGAFSTLTISSVLLKVDDQLLSN